MGSLYDEFIFIFRHHSSLMTTGGECGGRGIKKGHLLYIFILYILYTIYMEYIYIIKKKSPTGRVSDNVGLGLITFELLIHGLIYSMSLVAITS